jgi:cobalamin synthase
MEDSLIGLAGFVAVIFVLLLGVHCGERKEAREIYIACLESGQAKVAGRMIECGPKK